MITFAITFTQFDAPCMFNYQNWIVWRSNINVDSENINQNDAMLIDQQHALVMK